MNIVNLTPHQIVVEMADGQRATFQPAGAPARVSTTQEEVGQVAGIPLRRTAWGAVQGLPPPEEGTTYIVSALVADRARRPDVVSPDTGPTAIREGGQVVAVRAFVSWA